MKIGVNNNGLCRTRCKNTERKTKCSEISNSGTSQPGTLLPLKFPIAFFKELSKETGKYFIFYLLLKAEAPGSGWIQNYVFQIPYLAKKFGMTENEFLSYLQEAVKLKIALIEGDKIRLIGWKQLGHLFETDAKKRIQIPYLFGDK